MAEKTVFTVIGYYPDSGETMSEDVEAADMFDAAVEAYKAAAESGGSDFKLIAVIPGRVYDVLGLPAPMDRGEYSDWLTETD